MPFTIESNILPTARKITKNRKGGPAVNAKYPWRQMAIGDSFLVTDTSASKVGSAASSFTRFHAREMKFMVRTVKDGVRVWRIA